MSLTVQSPISNLSLALRWAPHPVVNLLPPICEFLRHLDRVERAVKAFRLVQLLTTFRSLDNSLDLVSRHFSIMGNGERLTSTPSSSACLSPHFTSNRPAPWHWYLGSTIIISSACDRSNTRASLLGGLPSTFPLNCCILQSHSHFLLAITPAATFCYEGRPRPPPRLPEFACLASKRKKRFGQNAAESVRFHHIT